MIKLTSAPGLRDYHYPGMVFKGGGGDQSSTGTSTTESSSEMDADFKARNSQIGNDLEAAYNSGELSQVAGQSSLQGEAFDAASGSEGMGLDAIRAGQGTYSDMMGGTGMFDPTQIGDLENSAINQAQKAMGVQNDAMASAGVLGGSRSAIVSNDLQSQLTDKLAQTKYDQLNRTQDMAFQGAQGMQSSGESESSTFTQNLNNITQLGMEQRNIEQEQLDATATGLERYITGNNALAQNAMTQTSKTNSTSESEGSSGGK
jgi:hypothetical protein